MPGSVPSRGAVYAEAPREGPQRWKPCSLPMADRAAIPGPAASGAVLVDPDGEVLDEVGRVSRHRDEQRRRVDRAAARARGRRRSAESGDWRVRLDSELVVKQLRGEYRVKHAGLQPLYHRAQTLLRRFEEVDIKHVPRKQNTLADRLVNRVLDQEAQAPVVGARSCAAFRSRSLIFVLRS